jgi:hypothetical protein
MSWDALIDAAMDDGGGAADAVADGEAREMVRGMTAAQRKEAQRQAARVRTTLDMPDWLKDELMRVADREQTTASSLASFLIARGLRGLRRGEVQLRKMPSESPRFEFLIEVEEGDAGL